ncbi:MAG: hypothetical protein KDM63_15845, partial [Verrucomicrobiae bacterium]|nr:hypothetical protein [Verrucomicrobiae bacterium]
MATFTEELVGEPIVTAPPRLPLALTRAPSVTLMMSPNTVTEPPGLLPIPSAFTVPPISASPATPASIRMEPPE